MRVQNQKTNMDIDTPAIFPMQEHVRIIQSTSVANHYRVFLDNGIEDPAKYRDLIQILISASENDLVELVVSCGGGVLDTTIDITNALRVTEAATRAVITSKAHSGGSFIALACDEVVALPHVAMMIHQPRGGTMGRHCEQMVEQRFVDEWIKNFYLDIYKDFLTVSEINSVLEGKDIWLNSDQINERANKREELRQKEEQKLIREFKKMQKEAQPKADKPKKATKVKKEVDNSDVAEG